MRIRTSAVRLLVGLGLASTLTGCIFGDQKVAANIDNPIGGAQVVAPNAQAALPLTVEVWDHEKEPMEDVTVVWSIKSGGGTISATETKTDGDGRTSVTFTAGPATGSTVVLATVPNLGTVSFALEVKNP